MTLAPDASTSACYLRLLANWGLGLAGLPLAVEDEDGDRGADAASLAVIPPTPGN